MVFEEEFDRCEQSRKAIEPDAQGILCPICWAEFSKDAINSGELSVEDVPQKSWGTSRTLLTCKICNNTFGGKVQGRVSGLKDIEDLKAGESKKRHRAKIVTEHGDFNAEVYTNADKKIVIKGATKINRPDVAEYWKELAAKGVKISQKKILLKQPFEAEALPRVLLRDAYLLGFKILGYPYIYTKPMQEIRTILHESKPIPDGAMLSLPSDPLPENTYNGRFFWVQMPETLSGFLVRWVVPEIGVRFIVLPFFPYYWKSYYELCNAWAEYSEVQEDKTLGLVAVEFDSSVFFNKQFQIGDESNGIVMLSGV